MRIVWMAVTLAMATVLLGAALEKARHWASLAATLRELGLERGATIAAKAVIALEAAVAIAVIFWPVSAITTGAVIALAISFAAAGLVAMRRGEAIACHCFGSSGNGVLGKNQLLALPLWVIGAAAIRAQDPPALTAGAAMFAAVGLTLAAVRIASALHEALRARGDRLSAKEMYVWLR